MPYSLYPLYFKIALRFCFSSSSSWSSGDSCDENEALDNVKNANVENVATEILNVATELVHDWLNEFGGWDNGAVGPDNHELDDEKYEPESDFEIKWIQWLGYDTLGIDKTWPGSTRNKRGLLN